jgi:putative glycosyltransferase (TIGR04372 family)
VELNKIILLNLNKHLILIRRGGIVVIIKKLRSLFYFILQIPIYLISIPTVIIIRLIRPWFLLRWYGLRSSRIGHFVTETELYCCKRDAGINIPSQRYLDFFYLHNKLVCNKQLEKMWRRSLIILPRWLLVPIVKVNRFINIFITGGNYHEAHEVDARHEHDLTGDPDLIPNPMRDIHNLLERFQPHISFTDKEVFEGKRILTEFGIPEGAKFVCLIVRDSGYLNRHKKYNIRDWSYHNYRDADIDNYVLAVEELARRGYYIFRMGNNVLKPLKSSNPKIIDYAASGVRSEFMDIYLGAKCNFCISSGTGFDEIPHIFCKPIVYTSYLSFGSVVTGDKKSLILTKHHINKRNQKELTVSEIFSSNVALIYTSEEFEQNDVVLEENSPEEIRDIVIEMDERLNGNWKETGEDLLLQKKFWSLFEENIKKINLKTPIHGIIKSRFGAMYLRKNQNWIK